MPASCVPSTEPSVSATWASRTLPSATGSLVESVQSSRVPSQPSSSECRVTLAVTGKGSTRTLTRRWRISSRRLRLLLRIGRYCCARLTSQRGAQERRSPIRPSSRYVHRCHAYDWIGELISLFPPPSSETNTASAFLQPMLSSPSSLSYTTRKPDSDSPLEGGR